MNLLDLIENLVSFGQEDADYIDIRLEKSVGTAIRIVDSKLKVGSTYNNIGVGIRAFINGSWGFISSTVLEKDQLRSKVKDAVKMAKIVSKNSKITFELKGRDTIRKKFPLEAKIKISDVDLEEKIKYAEEIDKQANIDERIVNTNSVYSDIEKEIIFGNSFGSLIEQKTSRIFCVSANYSKEGTIRQRGYRSIGGNGGYEIIKGSDDALNLGENAAKEAINLLSAKTAKGGTFNVLLDPKLTGVFIHEAFGHAAEADAVIASESILENKMDVRIAQEFLNVIDDPTINGNYGSYPIDDEGTLAKKSQLIENGVLKNYIHSMETSSRLDMEGNNGRTENFRHYPIVRMSNTYIKPGDWSFEEMIEGVNGVYAQGWIRGYTDPSTGAFMFKCEKANEINNGEIGDLIRDIAITGDTLNILKKIDAIGNNLEFSPGHCGKGGQSVPVTDGGPNILVSGLTLGGLR
ncbi:MAG: TldD/PmbA family protein [Candidatus Lokiarchaeota archaeon]|nr:TldD/PmbA family protein [Candidatus Lokiarchaeota archaeon]